MGGRSRKAAAMNEEGCCYKCAGTLVSDLQPPECENQTSVVFKLPHLWYIGKATGMD